MERKLYSLEAINSKNPRDRHTIQIKNEQGTYENKAYLACIDQYITMYFKNLNQLLYYLKQKKIIADHYDDIKITYRHNEIYAINLVYQDSDILKRVSKTSKSKINLESSMKEFEWVYNQFLNNCKKDNFLIFLNKSRQIPQQLKINANKYHVIYLSEDNRETIKVEEEIRRLLQSYKTFRMVVVYLDHYRKNKLDINFDQILPEKDNFKIDSNPFLLQVNNYDYDRFEKEEFLSEEELRQGYGEDSIEYQNKKI